jgi:hypothetical protein
VLPLHTEASLHGDDDDKNFVSQPISVHGKENEKLETLGLTSSVGGAAFRQPTTARVFASRPGRRARAFPWIMGAEISSSDSEYV